MKKTIALLLAFAMLFSLAACGNSTPSNEASEEISVAEQTSAPTAAPSPSPTKTPEPTEDSASELEPAGPLYTNPLTGEATETDISANRPFAAMLNTIEQALPQSSCGMADMLVEMPEEGGITRVMALYQNLEDIGNIGTIRSTREYYLYLAMGLDAIMLHAGCSTTATELLEETGYDTLDFMSYGGLYWRDSYRMENVGTEHSLYTSSENVLNYLNEHPNFRSLHEEGFSYPFTFAEDGTPRNGESAVDINVSFSGYKQTRFVYDKAAGVYNVFAYGDPYMDDSTDTQVTVTNVIVIPTKQTTIEEGLQRFDLTSGTGYYACGGKYVPIQWEKGDTFDSLRFSNADGTPLELGVGRSYICILDTSRTIDVQ